MPGSFGGAVRAVFSFGSEKDCGNQSAQQPDATRPSTEVTADVATHAAMTYIVFTNDFSQG